MNNINNYKIITLGASGAGKTVFLSSLFKELSTQGKHGFFLEVSNSAKAKMLSDYYSKIVSGDWPTGTRGEVQEWVFTCCVRNQQLVKYPACQFTYIDYKGGIITDLDDDGKEYGFSFKEELEEENNADGVLALLDGLKLRKFMDGKEDDYKDIQYWKNKDIPSLMQLVQSCKKIPVHFIISKWDLLEDKYTLLQVRNRLWEDVQEFRDVVTLRLNADCPVRLIPISSIGNQFAELQPDGRTMKKMPNANEPRPVQVEVPLAYVLTDAIEAEISKLERKEAEILQRPTEVKINRGLFARFDTVKSKVLSVYTKAINRLPLDDLPEKYRNNPALIEVVNRIQESIKVADKEIKRTQEEFARKQEDAAQETARLRQEQKEALKNVNNQTAALKHAFDSFYRIQEKFKDKFKESDLRVL